MLSFAGSIHFLGAFVQVWERYSAFLSQKPVSYTHLSGARAAGRDLTAEERAEFDGLQRQIDAAGNNPAQGAEGQGGEDPTGGARGMGNDNGQQGTDPTEAARQAVATERQRVSDITALCRQAGMDPAEYISNGVTMDTVRQAAVDYLLKHGAPVSSRMNGDEGDNFRQARCV